MRDTGVPDRTIEQADLSFGLPMGANWRAVGRWSYALNDDQTRTLEAFGGLEYDSCCLGVPHGGSPLPRSATSQATARKNYSNAVYFQFELKGLTGVGGGAEALAIRGIPGYENEF